MIGSRKRSVYRIILFFAAAFAMLLFSMCAYAEEQDDESEQIQIPGYVETDYGYQYTGSESIVTIPREITELNHYMFYRNQAVRAVIVPANVAFVSEYAFCQCNNLRYVCFLSASTRAKDHFLHKTPGLVNISAPKNSEIYAMCVKDQIPVTVAKGPCFPKKAVYLLPNDTELVPLYNSLDAVYATSNKKVVTVNRKTGLICAKKKGKTYITATVGNKKYRYTVVVYTRTESQRVKQIRKSEDLNSGKVSAIMKVKAAHDWMIRNVRYDYDSHLKGKIPGVAHTSRGSLIRKLCVCDGYAYGFKLIMNSLHIPCKVVHGSAKNTRHAWNMVKLGKSWYHVDVTWDDPIIGESNANVTPRYDYFLKSTDYMKSHSHNFQVKKYPKCTNKKYDKKGLSNYRNMLDKVIYSW